jgi:hypothetical protein
MMTREYLRQLQTWACPNENLYVDQDLAAQRRRYYSERPADYDVFFADYTLQTRDMLLNEHVVRPFLASLPPEVGGSLRQVCVGLLPSPDLNAWALRAPSGEPIVAVHSRAAQVIRYHSELLQAVSKLERNGAIQSADRVHSEGMIGIYRAITSDEAWPLPVLPDIEFEALSFALHLSTVNLWFILGHEFAHIHLGHLGELNRVGLGAQGMIQVERYNRSQQQEFEADSCALGWMLNADKHNKNSVVLFAQCNPVACLEIFTLFGFIEGASGHLGMSTATHPSARERLQFMLHKHADRLPLDAKSILQNWIESMETS